MDSNNHFNYGTSTNSGLKLSSGDSLYTNGSSMSFPQQGKNLNGEMNVNGVTTVHGSSVSGSHPPSAPYPHMSGHHQGGVGYEYLWGGLPQYGPGMGSSSGQGVHQKQPAPGITQSQSQHHFQSHGQYQLNGGVEASHQPPIAGQTNVPLTGNSQYWNRSNPTQQQMSYNSPSMYGSFHSQSHPGVTPSPHHQQQTLQPPAHQPSQQPLLSHHQSHHHHQQQQQQQHYSMMTNGMPFYQPPQQQLPQQSQSQTRMMPPAAQNFTPPRGSPQHHSLGRGSSSSPLPVGMSPTPVVSPPIQDCGSPKGLSRDRSPHTSSAGMSSPLQGFSREAAKEVDASHAGGEKPPIVQRSPKTDSYQLKPSAPHASPKSDYRQYSDQPAAPYPEVTAPVRDAVVSSHLQHVTSPLSASSSGASMSLMKASTPPGVSTSSGSPSSASGPPGVLTGDVDVPFSLSSAASSRISSPPVVVQGLRSSTSRASETSALGFKLLPQGHSSSLIHSSESISVGTVSSGPPASSSSEFLIDQTKSVLPPTSSKPTCVSPSAVVSITSQSATVASPGLPMSHGSKPVLPPSIANAFGGQHDIPAPPRLISAPSSLSTNSSSPSVASLKIPASSPSTLPVPSLSVSAAGTPSVGSKLSEPTSATSQYRKHTPPAVDTSLSTAFAALTPPRLVKAPSVTAQTGSPVRPPFTLPLTTQASRTAPLSSPPALVYMPPPMGTSSKAVGNSDSPNLAASSLTSERHAPGEEKREVENKRNRKPEESLSQLDSDLVRTESHVAAVETKKPEVCQYKSPTDPPGKSLQASEGNLQNASDLEKHEVKSSILSDAADSPVASTPIGKPPHLKSTRLQHQPNEESFDISSEISSFYDKSTFDSPSRLCASSILEKTSHIDGDASFLGDSSQFDTSQLDTTSCVEQGQSATFDSSGEGSFSVEDSRDDTMESTREEEASEVEATRNSSQVTEGSMLESSLDTTTQTGDSAADSSHLNNSCLSASSQPVSQDSEGGWEPSGLDAPDSAGPVKSSADDATTPSFTVREDNFVAFSTLAESAAVHPLQPVTGPTGEAAGDLLKTTSKRRRPRTPKTVLVTTAAPGENLRKPRVRTPKAEKMKTDEEGGMKEEGAVGRKRKKTLKVDVKETTEASGEAGSLAQEVDPITAAINAVLANASALSTVVQKPKKMKRVRKQDQDGSAAGAQKRDAETTADDADENDDSSTAGESNRRRVASEEQVQFPLQHGWKREIRVKKMDNRMKGETWYYTPCGRRMKQFPEIIKYLKKHSDGVVSREHFSFSPRMPVGDFYEERETSEGVKWVLLANEEVPSMIMAITGRRGRPPNPDKEKPRRIGALKAGQARRPGRPPKFNAVDLLSKVDAKLLNRLEAKEALTEEEKEKLAKIKKKMKRKARMKRREDLKIKKMKEEKKKAKLEQDVKLLEGVAEPSDPAAPQLTQSEPAPEPKKPGRRRAAKVEAAAPAQQPSDEKVVQSNRAASARSKAKALAKAQAEAEAAAQAALAAKRAAERRAQAQRRLEERKRQQLIAEELKKPTEDMCLTDHKPLPELSRVPGLVLSGTAFAHCLAVVEFLHGYGKIIGINVPKDIPSLSTLQEGLLGLGDSQGEVQDLLIKLVESALHDPGLPSYYQSVKILGEKLVDLELTRNTVSEVLRIYLESHGYETEVCNTLRTKTFHILPPDTKAAILGFLVEELNSSNIVMSDIDNTLENMATYRKNKWIIERKLRKLKSVLARRTGRSEEELCFEERRRSARVAEEENFSLEESGLVLERGSRRARKEEPKLSDSESPTTASIPELERQIDKLTKRQAFFRKKLLQSSHSMRVVMLGQDRYRRRYLALPHLGGVLVEGPEELLTSAEVFVAEVPVTFLKKEPKVEEIPVPTSPPAPASPSATPSQPQTASVEDDPLPGTASLMSTQRGRGRPRKIKPEVELHLRTAKIRRRRRSSVRSVGEEGPGSPNSGLLDLTQAAFKSWLSQSQDVMTNGGGPGPAGDAPEGGRSEESIKEMAEKHGQWFNLLPKQPCDDNSLTEPQTPASPGSPPKLLPQIPSALPALAAPLMEHDQLLPTLTPADPVTPAAPQDGPPTDLVPAAPPTASPPPPAAIAPPPAAPVTPGRPARRRRRGSSPARRGPRGAAAKRRGRPPNAVFQELEQQYFTQLVVKPIPASMVRGWWWIKDPEELYHTLQALHPRGIREKVLHKHLAKHMESLAEMCTKPINDPLFELKTEDKDVLLEALQQPWQVQEKAMEVDVSALQWVEDLEQRVIAADLHLKALPQGALNEAENSTETPVTEFQPYTIPDPDSTRDDLQYYEHDVDPRDDWIVRTKKEWSGLPRIATHPLDLAVLRLANLERNIERRYLKEPLWNPSEVMRLAPLTPTPGEELSLDVFSLESEITSRLRTWRQALDRCRSAPQLCLCVFQLEKAIAWERSVTKVTCQVCRKGDNDECLLLCDGCDRGCHMYCLKPKITQVPEGDWFCPTCVPKMEGELQSSPKKRTRTKKRRYEEDSSEDETTRRRSGGMTTRHKEAPVPSSSSSTRYSGDGGGGSSSSSSSSSSSKRRRITTRNQPDLTFCEIILMEMEAHADAWPFLEPVNPRLVPGYRRIIKNPMDFLTMRERLLQGAYCSCDEFAADAQLVFNNCELFNEDTSEVGMAGHSMRRFFESRWAEFYSNKDK
ncbi:PREDICTED: bromodomain adjacent to zinc finger domain protein 2A isoform X1 [Poecilia mexicana]|uniref:Bromodomain adjacent to zinc finger domain, 2A n=1 Tax=Poecilia mexicana TaxID=48701 RepID=A0A3B3XED3_9TELE|nr:PREDICTED: bromodomain adjacent to zinc finger domain protein 2A isoform X1 [Poecilia mexicana]XP_014841968.1 PREDICTED: bromodomain adjacent to zinc finger domain protein 2A isoform X1 [Poecilia mexicana]XP_014841970.1 PREDICTED: bromodomain adjacent to zinc finger domain protein 2A isoform X1 [Poecilia mexicana]XP_014841971.1 PREDICTED: bromodomain adjacent to zinc finger domain protein 2A isoform X1 [Poecilia mexicana]